MISAEPEARSATPPREVTDVYGRHYRVGESDRDLTGRSRAWMLWLPGVTMAAVSVLQYGYGLLAPTLRVAHGWSLVDVMWVFAVWVVFQAGVAFPTARLRQRRRIAPGAVVVTGGLLCLAGLVTLAHAGDLVVALVGFSVLGGTGAGLVYATAVTTVSAWFPECRSPRIGAVTGAFAYGAVPFILLFAFGLDVGNSTLVLDVTGAVVGGVVVVCGLLFRDPPRDWWPAHVDPQQWAIDKRLNKSLPHNVPAVRQYTPAEALRSRTLPLMYLILVSMAAVSLLGIAYLASFTIDEGFGSGVVALAVAGLAVVNGAGRTVAARLSDRFGRRGTLTAVLAVEGLAQFGLVASGQAGQAGWLVVFALLAGLGGGAFYPLVGSLVLDYFGERSAFVNYAVVYSAKALGGVLGVGAAAFAVTGSGYVPVFVTAGCVALASAGMTRLLHQPGHPTLPAPPAARGSRVAHG